MLHAVLSLAAAPPSQDVALGAPEAQGARPGLKDDHLEGAFAAALDAARAAETPPALPLALAPAQLPTVSAAPVAAFLEAPGQPPQAADATAAPPLEAASPAAEGEAAAQLHAPESPDAEGFAAALAGAEDAAKPRKAATADAQRLAAAGAPSAQTAPDDQVAAAQNQGAQRELPASPSSAPQSAGPTPPQALAQVSAQPHAVAAVEPATGGEGGPVRADPAFAAALSAQTQDAAAVADAADAAPPRSPAAAQVAAAIVQKVDGRSAAFDVRLDPPELGRVHIRLEVAADQSVRAIIAADQPAALAELARSARDIERALTDAGLRLANDALSFDLTGRSPDQRDGRGERAPANPERPGAATHAALNAPPDDAPKRAQPLTLSRWSGARLDLFA